jgi:hypothetical protein
LRVCGELKFLKIVDCDQLMEEGFLHDCRKLLHLDVQFHTNKNILKEFTHKCKDLIFLCAIFTQNSVFSKDFVCSDDPEVGAKIKYLELSSINNVKLEKGENGVLNWEKSPLANCKSLEYLKLCVCSGL